MPFKPHAELEEIRQNLYDIVWPLVSDFENKNWHLKSGTNLETGLVYRGDHKTIGTVWKLEVELPISPKDYLEKIILAADLLGWVPNVDEYEVLERSPDKDWEVTYSHVSKIGPVSARDTVALNFLKLDGDGSLLAMTISTEHPKKPKNPNAVRAEYLPTAAYLKPHKDDPNKCTMYWVNNIDLKGYLLRSVVNLVASTFLSDFGNALVKKTKTMAAERH